MNHVSQPRSVSWDDESLTVCSSDKESLFSILDHDDASSGVEYHNYEGEVEHMTPFEFGCHSHRLWYIEKINLLLRDICFGEGIVDQLPEEKMNAMHKSFDPLYVSFYLDRQLISWLPTQPNKALRWRVMGQIWRLLREHIFNQLDVTDRDPEFDPLLILMRDIVAEKIKQFVNPFKATATTAAVDLNSKIEDVVRVSKVLFRMLQYDSTKYSLYEIPDQSGGELLSLYSEFAMAAQKVDICGASHRDASKDRICISASAGLIRRVGHERFIEKKAEVVVYRP
ncbi:hypothetical protein ACQKWADRAFT_311424 [Trichoderma austrokoningii]